MSETVLALLIALTEASLAPDETASDAMTRTKAAPRRSIPRRKLKSKIKRCVGACVWRVWRREAGSPSDCRSAGLRQQIKCLAVSSYR